MATKKNTTITVQEIPVTVSITDHDDYISLTDMAKAKSDTSRAADVIKNWLRARTTLESLAAWETLYNPEFKVVEFDHFQTKGDIPNVLSLQTQGTSPLCLFPFVLLY